MQCSFSWKSLKTFLFWKLLESYYVIELHRSWFCSSVHQNLPVHTHNRLIIHTHKTYYGRCFGSNPDKHQLQNFNHFAYLQVVHDPSGSSSHSSCKYYWISSNTTALPSVGALGVEIWYNKKEVERLMQQEQVRIHLRFYIAAPWWAQSKTPKTLHRWVVRDSYLCYIIYPKYHRDDKDLKTVYLVWTIASFFAL